MFERGFLERFHNERDELVLMALAAVFGAGAYLGMLYLLRRQSRILEVGEP